MSNAWRDYDSRIGAHGQSRRDISAKRIYRSINRLTPSTLSYHNAVVDGEDRQVAIINSDNLDIKTICSMPGEDIRHGSYVQWMDNIWLIIERDANNEIYTRATMRQCNYLLRWATMFNGQPHTFEQWCVVEDGTKYMTGEYGDNDFVLNRGDSRIQVTLPRNEHTLQLGRDKRFIIDDYGVDEPLAYRLTKPLKLGMNFNGNGVLSFVLTECNLEEDDNVNLHIADYYTYFPRPFAPTVVEPAVPAERTVWI